MDFPVYMATINEDDTDSGISFVSLVDRPAIKKNFLSFAEDSWNDYPEAAVENAKTALRWVEENGWGDCGEATGKTRANQLANREKLTRDTIARMSAFQRHKQNSDKPLGDGCGRLMWLAWGGDEGIAWAEKKLSQIDKTNNFTFAIQSEEKRIITGPAMIADLPIYRKDAERGEFYIVFTAETIWSLAKKFSREQKYTAVNTMHQNEVDGLSMIESYFVNRERGINPPTGFEDVPDGSWFMSYLVDNDEVWAKVKAGEFQGFSIEGFFGMENQSLTAARDLLGEIENFRNSLK